jgi:hypothetical protein
MIPMEIIGFFFVAVVIMIVKIYFKPLLIGFGVVSGVWLVVNIPALLGLAAAYGHLNN